ncbi:MAG TPA: TRAP transporter substrate-binding protein [Acetobacteraceae bacterium]|jgi:tripartite ATP-independent transporter DctP family solute receptor
MRRTKRSRRWPGILTALIAAALVAPPAHAAGMPFVIALATGPTSPQNVVAKEVAAQIDKDTDGRIMAKVFESGQLGQTDALLQAMITGGGVQATITVVTDTICPPTRLFLAPYAFKDRAVAYAVLDSPAARQIYAVCRAKGYDFVAAWDSGFRQLSTNKPISGLADLKGLKIRVPNGALWIDTFHDLGANPTPMGIAGLYSDLQQGVVEGQEQPVANYYAGHLMEVQKYLAITNHMYGAAFFIVSEQWLSSLPADLRTIVVRDIRAATARQRALSESDEARELTEVQAKNHVTVTRPDLAPFRAATARTRAMIDAEFPAFAKALTAARSN